VTDPEELRRRAASIFEQLQQASRQADAADDGTDTPQRSGSSSPPPEPDDADAPIEPAAVNAGDGPDAEAMEPPGFDRGSGADEWSNPASGVPAQALADAPPGRDADAEAVGSESAPEDAPVVGASGAVHRAVAPVSPGGPVSTGPPGEATPADVATGPADVVTIPADGPTAPGVPGATALQGSPVGAARTTSLTGLPNDLPLLAEDAADVEAATSRPLPRILAIANQKGGVGKTTTAVNIGAALAELGYRVLVIDLDPQGNATTGLGINARNLDGSVYDVLLHDVPVEDCIEPTSLRNLFVVPATIDLAGAEIELVPAFSRELRLKRAVERVIEDFDFVLIDCPPSLGLLTVNGLAAAREVLVPIQCEYYALEGLGQLLRNVNLVRANLNPELEVTTIILTMYDARTRLAEQVVADVRAYFGGRVCRQVVPRTVRLSEAPSFGQPIIVFDSSSRGAIAYRELAREVSGGAPQRVG
jgi:chromosome partitioning protein